MNLTISDTPNLLCSRIRKRLHDQAGISDAPTTRLSFDQLAKTEWSSEFERLMRNRLILGAMRYGVLRHRPGRKWGWVASLIRRAQEYQQTGNLELLVDIANLALCEFEDGGHPLRHWEAKDDTGDHAK